MIVCSLIAIIATIGVAIAESELSLRFNLSSRILTLRFVAWIAIKVRQNRSHLTRTSQPMTFLIRVLLFGFVDLFTLV